MLSPNRQICVFREKGLSTSIINEHNTHQGTSRLLRTPRNKENTLQVSIEKRTCHNQRSGTGIVFDFLTETQVPKRQWIIAFKIT